MFKWLKKLLYNKSENINLDDISNKILESLLIKDKSQDTNETKNLSSIEYAVTSNQDLACEIEINNFDGASAANLGKLLLLIEQGQLINITVDALKMLLENNVPEQSEFVKNVLSAWQKERNNMIRPIVKPTDVFKEK